MALEEEIPQGEEEGKDAAAPTEASPKAKKKKKAFDPLSDDPIKFKKIDFENALTAEEKAAKKAAKLAAKKGSKKKKEKPAPQPEAAEPPPTAAVEETVPKQKKKGKKEIKDAGGDEVAKEKPTEEKAKKKGKGKKQKSEAAPAEGEGAEKKEKKQKGKKEPAAPGDVDEKKGKKKGKGKATKKGEEEVAAEEGGEKKKKKGKKGEKSDKEEKGEETEGGEAPTDETQEAKGKKGKGKKGKVEGEEGKAGKKGKKGKGEEPQQPTQRVSITAFLEHFASMQEDDDEWTWESYSASEESIKEPEKEKVKKGKKGKKAKKAVQEDKGEEEAEKEKGKKGKKGKKKGKVVEETPEAAAEVVSVATDIMAEIRKMKELAEAQALGEVGEGVGEEVSAAPSKKSKKSKKGKGEKTEGPKEPKEPKKKLSKKEKAKLAAEMAEQARIQAEIDAKLAEEAERIRLIEERKAAIEKEKRETIEQRIRVEQLTYSMNFIRAMKKRNIEKAGRDREHDEWEHFLKCDGLPNPYVCGEMNTYLHLWEKTLETITIDEAAKRTNEVLQLLEMVTTFIDDPASANQTQIDNWKWIHYLFREHQQKSFDMVTYRLLRDISKNLNSLDLLTSDYQRKEANFALSLWVLIKLPTPKPNPRKPEPPRIDLDFPDMQMKCLFPISIDCYSMAIRAMYVKYDHLSDLCSSYPMPPIPEQYTVGLYKLTLEEWRSKLLYKYESHKKARALEKLEEGAEAKEVEEVPQTVDRAAGIIPVVPYRKLEPSASTHVITEEDIMYMEIRQSLLTTVDEHVINLRKYIIVGGVYFLNLYYQPPQPQDLVSMVMTVTRLKIPKCLGEVPFHVEYHTPPPPIDPVLNQTPEELDVEMKKQEEDYLDELLLVTLALPEHVMWLDVPVICQWDDEKRAWTTADIHDLKHIEEECCMTFRTARFGCFSLAMNRYLNLPFQSWEIKPEQDGTVTFQITAAILLIEFNIKDDLVCILRILNSPNKVLQERVGQYFKLPRLIRILQERGLDFFPAFDAFCYIEGTCEKHWPMEEHLYYNMAQLSTCFNFVWSRWNMIAGRRSIIMQMREYKPERPKQVQHSMLQVTPVKAHFIECTELDELFCEDSKEGMHFYSDLYHLMKGTCGMATKNNVQNTKPELVGAVADLLLRTRVLSFS